MPHILGGPYQTLSSNTTISANSYYAVQAISGDVTVTLTPENGNNSDKLTSITIPDGVTVSCVDGWQSVQKTSGNGTAICYKR